MHQKGRYCRQEIVKGTNYCGNHGSLHKRIPCPIDPSHSILESQVEKHVRKCPFLTRKRAQQEASYYRENCNCGGHGTSVNDESVSATKAPSDVQWAHNLALEIIRVHQRIFTGEDLSNDQARNVSLQDVVSAIPFLDLSQPEVDAGLQHSVDHYMIKSGGARHLAQQASLVGHLRRIGVFDDDNDLTLLEMGAGRGMFGLIAAGVAASSSGRDTKLILVERTGSRSKADGVLRMAKDDTKYMALPRVQFSRITCDLAHVYMPTVMQKETSHQEECPITSAGVKRKHDSESSLRRKMVVIAKHLCGAGTDLALKSLQELQVDACVMATCCHGVCSWDDYVGRNFLKSQFGDAFGQAEFNLLRRWSSGTVSFADCCNGEKDPNLIQNFDEENEAREEEHGKRSIENDNDRKDPMNASAIISSLGLDSLGPEGLGRACQRLLDQGRLEYMQDNLFQNDADVEIFHYIPSNVTPQNAVLVARRK